MLHGYGMDDVALLWESDYYDMYTSGLLSEACLEYC
jgi:hypothetical protein